MSEFLKKHTRQPKIYIDIPSNGEFYDESVLQDMQVTNIPVFGMTTMDEIMLKTPDALFSGEATANVIKSCIPSILDPWKLVGYDIDYILIAIRIASYGDTMPVQTKCPKCSTENENNLSLGRMLEAFRDYPVKNSFLLGDLKVNLAPITYRTQTDFSKEQYVLDRQVSQISKLPASDPKREKQLNEILTQMTELTLRLSVSYIDSITDGELSEASNPAILEFIKQNDAKFYQDLRENVKKIADAWKLPTVDIECAGEECDHTYKSRVTVDYANFFGLSSLRSRNLILSS